MRSTLSHRRDPPLPCETAPRAWDRVRKGAHVTELKTKRSDASVTDFLDATTTGERREDCASVLKLMKDVTKWKPRMWGSSIVGFGTYRYEQRGKTMEWLVVGFSPRKANLTLYVMPGCDGFDEMRARLGKCKTAVSCIYVDRLSDIDLGALKQLVAKSVAFMKDRYPTSA